MGVTDCKMVDFSNKKTHTTSKWYGSDTPFRPCYNLSDARAPPFYQLSIRSFVPTPTCMPAIKDT